MRNLKRNQQTVYFKNLIDSEDIRDDYGNLTGTTTRSYGELQSCEISVSGNKGTTENQSFGVQLDYDMTLSTADMKCAINEFSILWIDRLTTEPHNYIVKKKSKTLNQILYAVKAVNVNDHNTPGA